MKYEPYIFDLTAFADEMIYGYSQVEFISGVLILVLATISLISTLITLWLIHDMNRWNGYMLLIFNLTLCQSVYDVSFYLLLAFRNKSCFGIHKFLSMAAGMSVTLWTNVISVVLYYIIIYLKSFNIHHYYRRFLFGIMFISFLFSSTSLIAYFSNDEKLENIIDFFYYVIRLGSIIFNIIVHVIISYVLYQMGLSSVSPGTDLDKVKKMNDPLKKLSARLKYYPIVQIITWVGAAWYEFQYGYTRESFDRHAGYSFGQKFVIYVYDICSPSAGLGFFLVFLFCQPTAYRHLKSKIRYFWNKTFHYQRLQQQDDSGGRYQHGKSFDVASERMKSRDSFYHEYGFGALVAAGLGSNGSSGVGGGSGGGQTKARSASNMSKQLLNGGDSDEEESSTGANNALATSAHLQHHVAELLESGHRMTSTDSQSTALRHTLRDMPPLLSDGEHEGLEEYVDEEELAKQVEYKYSVGGAGHGALHHHGGSTDHKGFHHYDIQ